MSGSTTEVNKLVRELRRQGCTAELTKGGHWKVTRPNRQPVYLPATPGGGSSGFKKYRALIRRHLDIVL